MSTAAPATRPSPVDHRDDEAIARRPIPPFAWLLTATTAIVLAIVTIPGLHAHGTSSYFAAADGTFYRATAVDLFGTGRAFARAGLQHEIAYRYGRIGFPAVGWLFALGQPRFIPWSLVFVQLSAIAAIPGLAVVLADEYGAPPIAGAAVLLSSLVFIRGLVYAEPLLIALILLAYVLVARQRPLAAWCVFAFAILTKETAVLALLPFVWHALRRRNYAEAARYATPVVPYLVWEVIVRMRVGEFPSLARTTSRSQAISLPGGGIRQAISDHTTDYKIVVALVVLTLALCCVGAYVARHVPIGGLTGLLAAFFACLGINALRFPEETFRLLSLAQVFGWLCVAVAIGKRLWPTDTRPVS